MSKAKVTDVTGRKREEQVKAMAEEQAARATEMTMATAVKEAKDATEIVDMTIPSVPTVLDEVESVGVSLADDMVIVRVAENIENMTLGAGNNYSFEAGKKYKVKKAVANHLQEKGYLYDRM